MSDRKKTLTEAAQRYRGNHHWVPLRLDGKSPDCMGNGWNKRTLESPVPKFEDDDNIGILLGAPSGDLVRLDPDFPGISAIQKILFPEPTAIFGRASSPQSGRLVICKDLASRDFILPPSLKDDERLPQHDGKPSRMVFQILATGKQTMVPPSVHPETREEIIWESSAPPATIEPSELLWRCGLEAFLLAVCQFWPPVLGNRNKAAMALARVLLDAAEARIPDENQRIKFVDGLVEATAMAGGDGIRSRRGKQRAKATLRRLRDGKEVLGMTGLVEMLGLPKDVAKTFREWLGITSSKNLPVIQIAGGRLSEEASRAQQILFESDLPVFQRGGELRRPVVEEVDAADGKRTNVAQLIPIDSIHLRDILNGIIDFQKPRSVGDGLLEWYSVNPPHEIALTILKRRGHWQFPVISGVISTPTMRPDGSLLIEPGYDPMTRLLLIKPPVMLPIPEQPTHEDALLALALLESLLIEFPLADDVARSCALSAIITPVVRGAFPNAPMHAARAPVAASGKSYLFDTVATIAIGQRMPVMTAGQNEEETEKRLGAALLAGQPLISIDNVNGQLRGDALCQIVERPVVKIRILGKSELMQIETQGTTMFCTGNNLVLVGDLCRRAIIITLDPRLERPELREFKGNPVAAVLADRGRFIAAALTICRAYIVAGRPDKAKPLASFEGWSDTVRSALIWLGKADPVESMELARTEDPELGVLREFLAAWAEVNGIGYDHRCTMNTVIARIKETDGNTHDPAWPKLHDAVQAAAAGRRAKNGADAYSLGIYARRIKDRVVGELCLRSRLNKKSKVAECWVEHANGEAQTGTYKGAN